MTQTEQESYWNKSPLYKSALLEEFSAMFCRIPAYEKFEQVVLHSAHGVTDVILKIASCQNKQLKLTDVLTDQRKMTIPKALSVCTSVLGCQRQKNVYHLMLYTWRYLRQKKVSCTPGTGFSESQEEGKHITEKLTICMIWVIHSELQVYENKNIFNSHRLEVKDNSTWVVYIHCQN